MFKVRPHFLEMERSKEIYTNNEWSPKARTPSYPPLIVNFFNLKILTFSYDKIKVNIHTPTDKCNGTRK